ncbi:MAG: helix-turn-helix domain-containing protein [Firmicutes bacterium]|nr:helix-turn-helix domain-containing protein [Bacillota bacterium]
MYKEKFVKNLSILMENKSIYKAAKDMKIPYATLYGYVNGIALPNFESLIMLADYFDEELDYLVGRKD